jgi:hypothetical protein
LRTRWSLTTANSQNSNQRSIRLSRCNSHRNNSYSTQTSWKAWRMECGEFPLASISSMNPRYYLFSVSYTSLPS